MFGNVLEGNLGGRNVLREAIHEGERGGRGREMAREEARDYRALLHELDST